MSTTLLAIIVIAILLVALLEIDHFITVRRMNRQLDRSKRRAANGKNDSDRLQSNLIELEKINNKLEGK